MNPRYPLGVNDITIIPPPTQTPERAQEIYEPAFRRVMEYITVSRVPGDVLEFGTFHGYTARTLAELMRQYGHKGSLNLYDSWEGFPEMKGNDADCPEVAEHKTWNQGDCRPMIENAPEIIQTYLNMILPGQVHIYKGFYEKTLVPANLPAAASIVHVDCDLYESTKLVLTTLIDLGLLQQGTVILFDDWNNNFASNDFGERRAVCDIFGDNSKETGYELEHWFTYGSAGYAFIVQKS